MGAQKSSGRFEYFFLEFCRSLGLGNTNLVEKYVELPKKHEPMLKPLQEERPKTSLALISLIEKLEQYLGGLRKRVGPRCKGDIWDVIMLMWIIDLPFLAAISNTLS